MFVVSKRNIILPSEDGSQAFPLAKGFMGEVPEWASDTEYFRLLVEDGKIGVPESKKDAAVEAEVERQIKRRKPEE